MKKIYLLILIIVFLFSSCGKAQLIESLEAEVSDLNEDIESLYDDIDDLNSLVKIYEAMPTITPVPTPTPTPEPTPEATPVPEPNLQLENIIALFEAAELPVEDIIYFDEATDPNNLLNRPGSYVGKVSFEHPRSEEDHDCTIEIFSNEKDLNDREKHVYSVYESYPLLRRYTYKEGLALFRLTYDVLPSQAEEYEAVFRGYWK